MSWLSRLFSSKRRVAKDTEVFFETALLGEPADIQKFFMNVENALVVMLELTRVIGYRLNVTTKEIQFADMRVFRLQNLSVSVISRAVDRELLMVGTDLDKRSDLIQ